MSEVIEVLEGCIKVLEGMDEESHDPRHYSIIACLRWVLSIVDEE